MGVLSKLFGSDKVIDAGISGIDKAFYTKEERAEDELTKIGYKMAFMKLYEPFKVAQRFVALIVGIPFVSVHIVIMIAWVLSIYLITGEDRYTFVTAQLNLMQEANNQVLGEPFMWIVIFYFAGGAGEGLISKYMSRKQVKK